MPCFFKVAGTKCIAVFRCGSPQMLVSLQSSPPLLNLSGRFTGAHLFLQKSLFLHSLLQRQANPLSLGLRDDKTLSKQQKASVRYRARPEASSSKQDGGNSHLVLVIDGCSPLRVIRMQLGVLASKPQKHPSLQVHAKLGTQVFLWGLAEDSHRAGCHSRVPPTPSADPVGSSSTGTPIRDQSRPGIGISTSIQVYVGQAQGKGNQWLRQVTLLKAKSFHWGWTKEHSVPLCFAKACNGYPGCYVLPAPGPPPHEELLCTSLD